MSDSTPTARLSLRSPYNGATITLPPDTPADQVAALRMAGFSDLDPDPQPVLVKLKAKPKESDAHGR